MGRYSVVCSTTFSGIGEVLDGVKQLTAMLDLWLFYYAFVMVYVELLNLVADIAGGKEAEGV